MGGVKVNYLKARLVERNMSIGDLAEQIGVDRSTLYRKLNDNGAGLLIGEVNAIVRVLGLSAREASDIFFNEEVAHHAI